VADAVASALGSSFDCLVVAPGDLRSQFSASRDGQAADARAAEAMWRARLSQALIDRALCQPLIAADCGGEYVFSGAEALRVRLIASFDCRVNWLASRMGVSSAEAVRAIESGEYINGLRRYSIQPRRANSEPRADRYQLLLNLEALGEAGCVELIASAARGLPPGPLDAGIAERLRHVVQARLARALSFGGSGDSADGTRFAHPSERMFARLLDFYRIPWQYEPRTFALERDASGHVTVAFTPDFYLPAQDLYIELTTMKQRLVTRKNRKLRRLSELFPEVKVRILYQRDLEDLAFRMGVDGGSVLG
jgi:hypothetical protein